MIDVVQDLTVPTYFTPGIDRAYPDKWGESYPHHGSLTDLQMSSETSRTSPVDLLLLGQTEADSGTPGVIGALRRRYDELTHSQKRIAETIVEDPRFVAFATLDKFSARLGVSPSTIVRFAYRIGLSGYPELQEQVRELVLKGLPHASGNGDSAAHLGETVFARVPPARPGDPALRTRRAPAGRGSRSRGRPDRRRRAGLHRRRGDGVRDRVLRRP